jgi:hypothetical protein
LSNVAAMRVHNDKAADDEEDIGPHFPAVEYAAEGENAEMAGKSECHLAVHNQHKKRCTALSA